MNRDEKEPTNRRGDAFILVGVLVLFALVLGGVGLRRYAVGRESASWPQTMGTITASRVQSSRRDNRQEYLPAVTYTYKVDQKGLVGSRVTASDTYRKSHAIAGRIIQKYPVGSEVTVYYNPEDPAVAVLETGLPGNVYALLVAAAFCLLFAGAIAVSSLRRSARPPSV